MNGLIKNFVISYIISQIKMAERQVQVNTYTLNIQSIKMKVKFPCRMKLEYNGEALTGQVSQNDTGKFIFNQQITVKQDLDRNCFQIIAQLITDKGSKYIAGVVKLMKNQLTNQEGEMLISHLSKCLDPEATCELRVDQISVEKVMTKMGIEGLANIGNGRNVRQGRNMQYQDFSPVRNVLTMDNIIRPNQGSKSQFQFPINNNKYGGHWDDRRSKKSREDLISYQPKNRSPHNFRKTPNGTSIIMQRNLPQFGMDPISRDRLIQAEVYKQSYLKLKQKYKKQAQNAKHELNKRISLQNNENNYKLEIMRLKLKAQEHEKSVQDKNNKIKQYQIQLAGMQKKELDLEYLKQQNANKDHTIRMLEQTIRTLNRDNDDLKALNRDRFDGEQDKIKEMRNQIQNVKNRYQKKINDLDRQLRITKESIVQKQAQVRLKDERIDREQKLVDQLQRMGQTKLLQYQRALQSERNQSKLKCQQLRNQVQQLLNAKRNLQNELNQSKNQHEKVRSYLIKIQYDKKIMNQQSDSFKTQLLQLKTIKQKYLQISREHKLLLEEKNQLQKQYEKSLQNKQSNIYDLSRQNTEQIQYYKKINRELQEKLRTNQSKLLEAEAQLDQKKNDAEKLRRNNQSINRDLNDLRERQKNLKRNLKTKQDDYLTLHSEFQSFKHKYRSGDQISRYQMDNLREEIAKAKRDLDSQAMKVVQYTQKNSTLSHQLNQTKMKLQYIEDQNQKNIALYKQKISGMESHARENDRKIDDLNSTIHSLRNSDKEGQSKSQKLEIQLLRNTQKMQRLQKQVKMYQEKLQQSENQMKNKLNEIAYIINIKEELEKKLESAEEKISGSKNNYNLLVGEKNKNEKIIQILNRQLSDVKQQNQRYVKTIGDKQKLQDDLRTEIKKGKEEILKLQMKSSAVKKQFDRFKQLTMETLSTTFGQLPISPLQAKSSILSLQSIGKGRESTIKENNDESKIASNDIINTIVSQNKDIKTSLNKLIQQNKMLKKELDKAHEDIASLNNNSAATNANLNKQIQNLEEELQKSMLQREQLTINLKSQIKEMSDQNDSKQNQINELTMQIQELNFTINSLQMDMETKTEHYEYKTNQYKSKIMEIQQKITFQNTIIQDYEKKIQDLQTRINQQSENIEDLQTKMQEKQKQLKNIYEQSQILKESNEEGKKMRKEMLQKISDLEIRLNTEKEMKEKGQTLLNDEEHKSNQLKQFIATLMKQKETAIKSQLEKSQIIISLEGQLIEIGRQKETAGEENQRLRKNVEELKQNVKKYNSQIKQFEANQNQEKTKYSKLNQKLKDTERQVKQNNALIEKMREQHHKQLTKLNKQISQLQTEISDLLTKQQKLEIQNNEKINQLTTQIQEAQSEINTLKTESVLFQENLFTERQNLEVKNSQNYQLQQDLDSARRQLKNLQENLNNLTDELREKQEAMFQLAGKTYNLELKIQAKERQKIEKVETTIDDWSSKYEGACEEYDQRIGLMQKQRDYFKERLEEKEEEYRKVVAELRNAQLDDGKLKKALQEKARRLQEQRLQMITAKNSQIQRLAEENKSNFDALKMKESELRKIQHQLEIARSTINKLEHAKKETDQKIKNINKVYQAELEQLKKKEAANRSSRQTLGRIQWDIERDVKRTIQSYSKKFVSDKESPQKIISHIKSLEDEIINSINAKLNHKEA